ncbi:MAG: hypothetical protein ACQEQI_06225 [Bacillota bacterium]
MNKYLFLMVGFILVVSLGGLVSFDILDIDPVYHFLTENLSVQAIIWIMAAALGLIITYLIIKFKLWSRFLSFYQLNLNGKFILRTKSLDDYFEFDNYEQFKDKLAQFQSQYDYFEYNVDYSSSSINIELRTPRQLRIKGGEDYLSELVDDLNEVISLLSTEELYIDLNITGEISNLVEKISFVIVNQNNRVGINKNRYLNTILSKFQSVNN